MGLRLWKKKRLIRRFSEPVNEGGFSIPGETEEFYIMADVQTTDATTTTGEDGDHSVQHLKVFTDTRLHIANEMTKTQGDWLWFQGRWFECRSARLSENTFLKHWTCTFVELKDQPEPPEDDPNTEEHPDKDGFPEESEGGDPIDL